MKLNKILIGLVIVVIIIGLFFYFKSRNQTMPDNYQSSTTDSQNQNQTPPDNTQTTTPDTTTDNSQPADTVTNTPPADQKPAATGSVAIIDTNLGSFEVTLDAKAAPKTVTNFIKLANENYCNNTKFHRIIKDFVIQGCDPNSIKGEVSTWGKGGPDYTVEAEIGLKANVGAIGMASTKAKGPSSGSQFFIVTTENPNNHASLDGNYTFFGYVTSGMDVVTKIASVPVQANPFGEPSLPVTPVIINKITIK